MKCACVHVHAAYPRFPTTWPRNNSDLVRQVLLPLWRQGRLGLRGHALNDVTVQGYVGKEGVVVALAIYCQRGQHHLDAPGRGRGQQLIEDVLVARKGRGGVEGRDNRSAVSNQSDNSIRQSPFWRGGRIAETQTQAPSSFPPIRITGWRTNLEWLWIRVPRRVRPPPGRDGRGGGKQECVGGGGVEWGVGGGGWGVEGWVVCAWARGNEAPASTHDVAGGTRNGSH